MTWNVPMSLNLRRLRGLGSTPQAAGTGAATQSLACFTCLQELAPPRTGLPEGYPMPFDRPNLRGHLEK